MKTKFKLLTIMAFAMLLFVSCSKEEIPTNNKTVDSPELLQLKKNLEYSEYVNLSKGQDLKNSIPVDIVCSGGSGTQSWAVWVDQNGQHFMTINAGGSVYKTFEVQSNACEIGHMGYKSVLTIKGSGSTEICSNSYGTLYWEPNIGFVRRWTDENGLMLVDTLAPNHAVQFCNWE